MRRIASAFCACLVSLPLAFAQRGGGDWMTSAFDAQRSNWVRNDGKIDKNSLSKPGFELVWKMKLGSGARQLNTLTPPALLDFYIGYRGFRSLGFFGTSSDKVIGVDIDLGRVEWEKSFTGSPTASTPGCPGGLTSAVTRPLSLNYPPVPTGAGMGRGTPAKSGVSEPYEGAVTIRRNAGGPPPGPPKPFTAAAKPGAPAFNPFAPRIQWVLALTGDGKLHSFYVSNGEEPAAGSQFVPAGANAHGLMAFDSTAYVATTGGCGGAADGVWAMDVTTKQVTQWKAPGKGIMGTVGPAADPNGTLYVTSGGGELTALAPKTLEAKGTYKTGGPEFTSSPLVFEFKGRNLIAAATADGRIHLIDSANLSAPLDRSAEFSTGGYETGALASWQDPSGTRWILAPSNKSIAAFKVVEKNGVAAFETAWTSRDLVSPVAPIIVNGVVFALSSGEYRGKDASTAAQRAQKSVPAVLYALDSATGKEIWSSGKTITSFVHSGVLAAGGSRVYVGAHDGTQYAFSFPMEH